MRAEAAAQLRLLDLQDLDTVLGQLAHRRRKVPQIAELAAISTRSAELRDHEVAVRTAVSDLEREMGKAEADVAQVRERITRDQALLDAGSVASARQLEDLQREIENLARRVSALEDAELEVMEKLEDAQTRATAAAADVAELAEAQVTAERARDMAFADIDAEVARVQGERDRVVTEIPDGPAGALRPDPRVLRRSGCCAPAPGPVPGLPADADPCRPGSDPFRAGRRGGPLRGVSADPRAHRRVRPVRHLVIEADGGSRGNPGPAAYGAVVIDGDTGEVLVELADYLGEQTNNVAEYEGVTAGLAACREIDPDAMVEARLDSKLVVEQLSGGWAIKNAKLRELALRAKALAPADQVRYTWVPRAQNKRADALANQSMDAAAAGRPGRIERWHRGTGDDDVYVDVADHLGDDAQLEAEGARAAAQAQAPGAWLDGAAAAEAGAAQVRALLRGEPAGPGDTAAGATRSRACDGPGSRVRRW